MKIFNILILNFDYIKVNNNLLLFGNLKKNQFVSKNNFNRINYTLLRSNDKKIIFIQKNWITIKLDKRKLINKFLDYCEYSSNKKKSVNIKKTNETINIQGKSNFASKKEFDENTTPEEIIDNPINKKIYEYKNGVK
jgi:hypothetical protein